MAPRLAWIGLGNMGRGMCKNLIEKGNLDQPLILYNRTRKRADDLSQKLGADKTQVASSIPEATAAADIIFICVGDDPADCETIESIVSVDVTGKLVVDCSTVHPDTTTALEKTLLAKGAAFVAGPVFGAPAMADAGQLIFLLAGPKESIAKVTPYCKGVMGRAEIKFEDEPVSKPLLLKLIGNGMVMQMVESIAGAMVMAETSGVGVDHLFDWISMMWPGVYPAYTERMRGGDYYKREEPLFQVDLARKDIRHAMDIAKSGDAKIPVLEVIDRHLVGAKAYAGQKADMAAIYGAIRVESGLPYENNPQDKGKAKSES